MKNSTLAIVAGIAVLSLILVSAAINPVTLAQREKEKEKEDESHHVVMQVDIANNFTQFGQPGFFKLLADFTDMRAEEAHVAISNVQCDEEGTSPFAVIVANANVGAGNTDLVTVPLNSTNLIDDVSFKGQACTYHVDIDEEDYDFPVTDIALANGNDTSSFKPLSTASATVAAEIEEEDELVQAFGENSEVVLAVEDEGHLGVEVADGDLADGTYNVTFACNTPDVDLEFPDALTVEGGEGEFETELALSVATYDGCEATVDDLTVLFPSFTLPADGEDEDEDENEADEE